MLKIASWNVNSIRARLDRLLGWLETRSPDLVCLQETKCEDVSFPYEPLGDAGYEAAHFGQKSYNGVAILSRKRPTELQRGFSDGAPEDPQSRLIWGRFDEPLGAAQRFEVVSVYAPNGQSVGSDKYAYKLDWYRRLTQVVKPKAQAATPVIICGDFNIAPHDLDVHDPAAWHEQVLCSTAERAAFTALLETGLTDTLPLKRPGEQCFTWWDYRMLGFAKNRGLRIDHFLLNSAALAACKSIEVDREERKGKDASDHAPVIATFETP